MVGWHFHHYVFLQYWREDYFRFVFVSLNNANRKSRVFNIELIDLEEIFFVHETTPYFGFDELVRSEQLFDGEVFS